MEGAMCSLEELLSKRFRDALNKAVDGLCLKHFVADCIRCGQRKWDKDLVYIPYADGEARQRVRMRDGWGRLFEPQMWATVRRYQCKDCNKAATT